VLYAQIIKGAPFDIFLSADVQRPLAIEQADLSRFRASYALGQLVFWSKEPSLSQRLITDKGHPDLKAISVDELSDLLASSSKKIAIAKPELAPYGEAALSVLQSSSAWPGVKSRLVFGNNITQAFQFVDSGNAEIGILSRSMLVQAEALLRDSIYQNYRLIHHQAYAPIEQQLVVIKHAKNEQKALEFAKFLLSPKVQNKLSDLGYKNMLISSDMK
jgi:molybdenum ABC transporter molybdate-binding protein